MKYLLGIDLGGTNARAAVVDEAGKIITSAKTALKDRSPAAVVESIAQASAAALSEAGGIEVDACGVGVAGQLQGETGVVLVGPNLGWFNVPFGQMLSQRLQRSVRVINDLNVAAWGELKAGAGKGHKDLFVCFVGSGVGSALIIDGVLISGATGVAGEFGHVKAIPDGRPCGCGERGCVEAYVGGHNLIAQMKEAVAAGKSARMLELAGSEAGLNPSVLEKAAKENDPGALEIYQRAAHVLGLGIANQVTVLNPAMVVIGGGVLSNCPGLRQAVRDSIGKYAARASQVGLKVVDAALGDDSGLIGAALLAAL